MKKLYYIDAYVLLSFEMNYIKLRVTWQTIKISSKDVISDNVNTVMDK